MGFLGKPKGWKPNYPRIGVCLVVIIALALGAIFLLDKPASDVFEHISNSTVETSAQEAPKKDITIHIAAIGDIMCHSPNFKAAYKNGSYDFSSVFTDVAPYIRNADLAIGNLETTFAGEARGYSGYPTFNSPSALGKDVFDMGVDVVSTSNNHSLDKGYSGLVSTLDELDKIGLAHTGTYRSKEEQNTILTKEVNGIKFAFLAFTYGTNGISIPSGKEYCINLNNKDLIKKQIELAKQCNPDVICVNMHWGIEYQTKPNAEQKDLADFLFKNDVDIIIGSHPHVLQPMEKRSVTLDDGTTKDGFVIYSMGNFMSNQSTPNTQDSIILDIELTKHSDDKITIDSVKYTPIYMLRRDANSSDRYKILDIRKQIKSFENGTNKTISQSVYNTLKTELNKITSIVGEEI